MDSIENELSQGIRENLLASLSEQPKSETEKKADPSINGDDWSDDEWWT